MNRIIWWRTWSHQELKGSPEGSSDQEFRSSILWDVIEISWWLISRSIENLLKMTSPNFRVGSACLRLSPRLNSKVKWTPIWTTLKKWPFIIWTRRSLWRWFQKTVIFVKNIVYLCKTTLILIKNSGHFWSGLRVIMEKNDHFVNAIISFKCFSWQKSHSCSNKIKVQFWLNSAKKKSWWSSQGSVHLNTIGLNH